MSTYNSLPEDLPIPIDDGKAKHLIGLEMPNISLKSTDLKIKNLKEITKPITVLYVYPKNGVPGKPLPEGWDLIPGARGCTPEACGFRDNFSNFTQENIQVFGLSSQSTSYQSDFVKNQNLSFEIFSDDKFELGDALNLPRFEINNEVLYKRLTLIVKDSKIVHCFYPIFPPDKHAIEVLTWLKMNNWLDNK